MPSCPIDLPALSNNRLLHTNNLVPTNKRIESLALLPAVLHAAVPLHALLAQLDHRHLALITLVDRTHGHFLSRAEGPARVAFVGDTAAFADAASWSFRVAGDAAYFADVPDFELVAPDCGCGAEGEEREEGEEGGFELHGGCYGCVFFRFPDEMEARFCVEVLILRTEEGVSDFGYEVLVLC
jgi:hypothetical protein